MINKNLSVHLQDFPDLSLIKSEEALVNDMDMVRDICSAALFIRDKKNLRVRLPLNKLTIIGKNSRSMNDYKDIIADEVNVKNIEIIDEIGDLAELKLQINFKKVGAKFGAKMKEISNAAKDGNWKKIINNGVETIEVAGEILDHDDFEIKLITKDPESIVPLPSNDCLVKLDIVVTKELEMEGVARDIIRTIQQNRKDANLNISDRIKIKLFSGNFDFAEVIKTHGNYIKEQTLTDEIEIISDWGSLNNCQFKFDNLLDNADLRIGIDIKK
jgi:isoleucyl-tRNA synthetase